MKSSLRKGPAGRDTQIKAVAPAKARQGNGASTTSSPGLESLGDYQRHICELELKLSALRAQREQMTEALTDLKLERQHYAELYHSAPFGYLQLDALGNIYGYNEQAAKMLGVKSEEHLSGPFVRFVARVDVAIFLNHLHR